MPPLNLYARVRFLIVQLAHETAGAARTRSSLRPSLRRGKGHPKTRAHRAARSRARFWAGRRTLANIETLDQAALYSKDMADGFVGQHVAIEITHGLMNLYMES